MRPLRQKYRSYGTKFEVNDITVHFKGDEGSEEEGGVRWKGAPATEPAACRVGWLAGCGAADLHVNETHH